MKDVFTIEQADNGIMVNGNEHVEVIEDTHNPCDKDNLYKYLGEYLCWMIEESMDAEITNKVQVEINITKAE